MTYLKMRGSVNDALLRMHGLNPAKGVRLGVIAKMADRIANLRCTFRDNDVSRGNMYLKETDTLLAP